MDLSPVSDPRPDGWPGNQQSEHEGDEATTPQHTVNAHELICNRPNYHKNFRALAPVVLEIQMENPKTLAAIA